MNEFDCLISQDNYLISQNEISIYCINLAVDTIKRNRRFSNNEMLVPLAGATIYNDLWCRDGFITCLGLLETGNYDIIKQYLNIMGKYIRLDGLVPLRVGASRLGQGLKIFHINLGYDVPVYVDDKAGAENTDSNPSYIIMSALYAKNCTDSLNTDNSIINIDNSIIDIDKINKAFEYIIIANFSSMYTRVGNIYVRNLNNSTNSDEICLLKGRYFNSWYDAFAIDGPDAYSNVLFGYSIKCYEWICNKYNYRPIIDTKDLYNQFENSFRKHLYNGVYIKISPIVDVAEVASNSLAIIFGIVNDNESIKIIDHLSNKINTKMCHVTYPNVPSKYLYKPLYLIGMEGYQNDRFWPWVHFLFMTAIKYTDDKINYKKDNMKSNNIIDEIIEKNTEEMIDEIELSIYKQKTFCETVDENLNKFEHFMQPSEIDFSESCGSYLFYKFFNKSVLI